jgi:hypothetical protein
VEKRNDASHFLLHPCHELAYVLASHAYVIGRNACRRRFRTQTRVLPLLPFSPFPKADLESIQCTEVTPLSLRMTTLAAKAMNELDIAVNSTTPPCKLVEPRVSLFISGYVGERLEQGS